MGKLLKWGGTRLFVAVRSSAHTRIVFSAQHLVGVAGEERIMSHGRMAIAALEKKGWALSRGDFRIELEWAR
jgi:hypothetical protein